MKVLLPAYNDNYFLLEAYYKLHKKYWGVPITLVANRDVAPKGMDCLKHPYSDESHDYARILKWALNKIRDKFVIIMMADYFIYEKVNNKYLKLIAEYMGKNKDVVRCNIGNEMILEEYKETP